MTIGDCPLYAGHDIKSGHDKGTATAAGGGGIVDTADSKLAACIGIRLGLPWRRQRRFWNAIGSQIQAKSPAMRGLDSGVVEGTVAGGPGADKKSETGLLTTSWRAHVRQATGHNRQDDGQLDDGVEQSRRTGP